MMDNETEKIECVRRAGAQFEEMWMLELPRNSLTVITGLSGSGKSSLAFDTIFAEGQRRYIETFSAYARNFLGNSGASGCRQDYRVKSCDFHRTEDDQ